MHLPRGPWFPAIGRWMGELDIRRCCTRSMRKATRSGFRVVKGKGQPLLFRRWSPGAALVQGSFKVLTPPDGTPEVEPDVLLVPLLAFDRDGFRLGYGGGFYDRTLEKRRHEAHSGHPVLAIGMSFAARKPTACRADRSTSGWIGSSPRPGPGSVFRSVLRE